MELSRKAIILAAGMGTRLKPLTLNNHKCLTEINGIPILVNALNILNTCGFKQTTIVTGYLKQQIRDRIGNNFHNMKIVYADNDVYEKTNTSWSLKLGLERTADFDELYLLEGDVFFEKSLLENLLQHEERNITVLEAYRPDLDGTFTELDRNGHVIDWTHKSHRTSGYTLADKFKTVNIHKFSAEFVNTVLNKYLNKNLSLSNGRDPLENVMEMIVHENPEAINGFVLNGEKWFEIDDLSDLKRAEEIFLPSKL